MPPERAFITGQLVYALTIDCQLPLVLSRQTQMRGGRIANLPVASDVAVATGAAAPITLSQRYRLATVREPRIVQIHLDVQGQYSGARITLQPYVQWMVVDLGFDGPRP